MQQLPTYITGYWGKARPTHAEEPIWHPLAYHSLDVAAVADALLERSPRKLWRLAALCGCKPETLKRFLVALIALHDIGKFSRDFQAKSETGWRAHVLGPKPHAKVGVRHDAIGYEMLAEFGESLLAGYAPDWMCSDLSSIWASVTGHHGQPAMEPAPGWQHGLQNGPKDAANEFARNIKALFPPIGTMPPIDARAGAILSWAVAGLTVISDWIGSSETWLPYATPNFSLHDYWHGTGEWTGARARADRAIDDAGILPAEAPAVISAAQLFPTLESLSPLQQTVIKHPLPEGPLLAIVEDVTGSGKTEAAMLLTARLMANKRADGLFFALPTMATANAIYARLSQTYRRLFAPEATPSLVLAHGKRGLHEGFTSSILANAGLPRHGEARDNSADETANSACAAWIADDRRKAFLAHVGIGTIDQAILGVLPSRHESLRLWGLSDRVLVIDEAHSYDAYMSRELETLLEFHAALGGSAIILSATLAGSQRQKLVSSFARGLGRPAPHVERDDYPLLTVVSGQEPIETPVACRTEVSRALAARRIATVGEAVSHVAAMAERGAAVAWIRNAVDDAIEACELLTAQGYAPILLHARFAMGDRLEIEKKVQAQLGRDSTRETRCDVRGRGFVLVGTQILEQSLDYDVDAMVTDLAPVDMIIQRAGRLWRHPHRNAERPIGEAERELLIVSPDPADVRDKDWYRNLSKRAAAVYADHGLVWRSASALLDAGAIRTPNGVRALLAAVYDANRDEGIPEALERSARDAAGKEMASRSFANANLLKLKDGYGGNNTLWTCDAITPTRLGEPVTVFRLGKVDGDRIVPWSAFVRSSPTVSRSRAAPWRRWSPPPKSNGPSGSGSSRCSCSSRARTSGADSSALAIRKSGCYTTARSGCAYDSFDVPCTRGAEPSVMCWVKSQTSSSPHTRGFLNFLSL